MIGDQGRDERFGGEEVVWNGDGGDSDVERERDRERGGEGRRDYDEDSLAGVTDGLPPRVGRGIAESHMNFRTRGFTASSSSSTPSSPSHLLSDRERGGRKGSRQFGIASPIHDPLDEEDELGNAPAGHGHGRGERGLGLSVPVRAHSLSPMRGERLETGSRISSLLQPPSPSSIITAATSEKGRFNRLQKLYERVTGKNVSASFTE